MGPLMGTEGHICTGHVDAESLEVKIHRDMGPLSWVIRQVKGGTPSGKQA